MTTNKYKFVHQHKLRAVMCLTFGFYCFVVVHCMFSFLQTEIKDIAFCFLGLQVIVTLLVVDIKSL